MRPLFVLIESRKCHNDHCRLVTSSVYLTHDMNAEDREDYKRLVAEAKDKEQDEISGEFIYRVKWAPGSFRVIKIRKRY